MTAFALLIALACPEIDGLDRLLEPGRVLLFGELHGTEQSPGFVADVACNAAARELEVVVGLELADDEGQQWHRDYQDGRTSRAMAALIEALDDHSVLYFDTGGADRERAMAERLAASIEAHPQALHIVLTGNLHSRVSRGSGRRADFEPMGFLLKERFGDRVRSFDVAHAGGQAWICAPDCGPANVGSRGPELSRGVHLDSKPQPGGHDGWYAVGKLTLSPPAFGEHAVEIPEARPTSSLPADAFPEQRSRMLEPWQGEWEAYQYDALAWTIAIDGDRFRGVLGEQDWYEGTIRIDASREPAWIDFEIEDCRCDYVGKASRSIFRIEGERIRLAAPQPGVARPTRFSETDGRTVELRRVESPLLDRRE